MMAKIYFTKYEFINSRRKGIESFIVRVYQDCDRPFRIYIYISGTRLLLMVFFEGRRKQFARICIMMNNDNRYIRMNDALSLHKEVLTKDQTEYTVKLV